MALLPVEDALARMLGDVTPLESEAVPLAAARGRVLAADVTAQLSQPPFDTSAMDGYAVRAADVAQCPVRLRLAGEIPAGKPAAEPLTAGCAMRIFTGGAIPSGADAVVIQENTDSDGTVVEVGVGVAAGTHIRPFGQDFQRGQKLLAAGRVLDSRSISLAAAAGHATLPVRRKPLVAVLATGDELVEPGVMPGPGQIVSSNPYGLAAMLDAAGAEVKLLGIASDRPEEIAQRIGEARGADIAVTIGGASVGDHDVVKPALDSQGMALDFWKVAMRPGKPMMYGRIGSLRFVGLPGNPVSCLVAARVLLVPLLFRMLGRDRTGTEEEVAILANALDANGPRQHYLRAVTEPGTKGRLRATALERQDSALLADLAKANALLIREPGAAAAIPGAEVRILPFEF